MSNVNIESHIDEVNNALQEAIENTLDLCGQLAVGNAQTKVPVDTGTLKNSITHKVVPDEKSVYIGTNLEYAPYIELGTGIYAEQGGRKTPWGYVASPASKYFEGGKVHITQGQKPVHFLKRAITEHESEYKEVIERTLKNGMRAFGK